MKNIVIIGAGKGIGLKSAELLKNENLYTISRNLTPELESLETTFFQLDASKNDWSELSLPDRRRFFSRFSAEFFGCSAGYSKMFTSFEKIGWCKYRFV